MKMMGRVGGPGEPPPSESKDKFTSGEPDEPTPSDPYASAIQTARDTAKWLVTAVAGGAAVLLAGTQFSSLGELSLRDWQLWVALAFGALALYATGKILRATMAVLTPEWDSIRQLIKDEQDAKDGKQKSDDMKFLEDHNYFLAGKESVKELYSAYKKLPENNKEKERLEQALTNLLYAVKAGRIFRQLEHARKVTFFWGSIAAVGIIGFVLLSNRPSAEETAPPASEQSQLSNRIKDQQRAINSLSRQIDDLDQKVEDQQGDVRPLSRHVDTLDKRTDSLSDAVASLQESEAIRQALQERQYE